MHIYIFIILCMYVQSVYICMYVCTVCIIYVPDTRMYIRIELFDLDFVYCLF
jgi:hypothetical protein